MRAFRRIGKEGAEQAIFVTGGIRHSGMRGIGVLVPSRLSSGLSDLCVVGTMMLDTASPIDLVLSSTNHRVDISGSKIQLRRITIRSVTLITSLARVGLYTRQPAPTRDGVRESRVTPITTARFSVAGSSGSYSALFSKHFRHRTVIDRRGH